MEFHRRHTETQLIKKRLYSFVNRDNAFVVFFVQIVSTNTKTAYGAMTAVSAPDLPNDEQAWSRLLASHHNNTDRSGLDVNDGPDDHSVHVPMVQSSVLIKVDSAPGPTTAALSDVGSKNAAAGESSIGGVGGVAGASSIGTHMGERKPSFIDSFNRQLRSSFRAVSDSPGAIQR